MQIMKMERSFHLKFANYYVLGISNKITRKLCPVFDLVRVEEHQRICDVFLSRSSVSWVKCYFIQVVLFFLFIYDV